MATEDECREALEGFIQRLSEVDIERRRTLPDRTLGCLLLDLDIIFVGDLLQGEIQNFRVERGDYHPQIRLLLKSDDLIALSEGRLHFAHAWATGQVRLDASLRDLLRLRALV